MSLGSAVGGKKNVKQDIGPQGVYTLLGDYIYVLTCVCVCVYMCV